MDSKEKGERLKELKKRFDLGPDLDADAEQEITWLRCMFRELLEILIEC